jgi:hypothetical protein
MTTEVNMKEVSPSATLLAAMNLQLPKWALVVVPEGYETALARIANDMDCPVVFTNRVSDAVRLCSQGQPAIAFIGVSKVQLMKAMRGLGISIQDRAGAH